MKYAVIKIGGSILSNMSQSVIDDILLMKQKNYMPIVVHGGGPFINKQLSRMGVESHFIDGLRVTDDETLHQITQALIGDVNPTIVSKLNKSGPNAIGLNGMDLNLFDVEPLDPKFGHVATCSNVNKKSLTSICLNAIPVIAPISIDRMSNQKYNINADSLAYKISSEMNADLFIISDIPGVMIKEKIQSELNIKEINKHINTSEIYGGMIPKVTGAIVAIKQGCKSVKIIPGNVENALMKSIESTMIGTTITT